MKWYTMAVVFLLAFSPKAHAQIPKVQDEASSKMASPGKLLTQFAGALKPSSFLPSWGEEKNNWLSTAGKASSAQTIAQSISSLIGYIKPGMFKKSDDAESLIQQAGSVKEIAQASGLLKSLEGSLKPEAFLSSWPSQKSGWISALNLLI